MRCTLLLVVFLLAAGLTACGGSRIDQSSPAAVVEGILEAARTGEYGGLAAVVDPAGGDADAQDIRRAGIGDAEAQTRFKSRFSKGKVTGPPQGTGDRSKVPVLVGADGANRDAVLAAARAHQAGRRAARRDHQACTP